MHETKHDYLFPFDTCEPPQKTGMIAQPWSVLVNCFSLLITCYFLSLAKHSYSFALVLSILLFQVFHQFSHIVHIEGKLQTYIIHSLAIIVNFFYVYALYRFTKKFPETWFLLYVAAILAADMYALMYLPFIFYFFTQILLLVSTFVYYNSMMPAYYQETLPYIVASIFVLFMLFLGETTYCHSMLRIFPGFPFHAMTEIVGIIPLYLLLSVFYRL